MASIEEKVQSAKKRLENEKVSKRNDIDRNYAERTERLAELEGLVRYVDTHGCVFTTDLALRDMLANVKREAEGLLQKEFDKLRIPA